MCALGFEGKGYSPDFVKNFQKIVDQLNSEQRDQIEIEVVEGIDGICQPCPNHQSGVCQTEDKIKAFDERHAEVLSIKTGDTLTWEQAKKIIAEKMTLEKFHQACRGCSWKPLGICETHLKTLKKKWNSD